MKKTTKVRTIINRTIPITSNARKIRPFPHIIPLLLLVILSTLLASCKSSETSEEYKRNHPSAKQINVSIGEFAPKNNNVVILNYSSVFWSKIATYNLKTGEFKSFNIPMKQVTFPAYSPDGKKIAFLGALNEYGSNRNIYIMNVDGSEIRRITNFDFKEQKKGNLTTSNFVIAPSFSPEGNRIIYAKSRLKRERAYPLQGVMRTAWDVYEVEIATGIERRLTNYDFADISWPHYLPDGKRFIFSADEPVNSTGKGPKDFKEYEALYQKNSIFIMDGTMNELKPAFSFGDNSSRPCLGRDNEILFTSKISSSDEKKPLQDIYVYKNGKFKRLTNGDAWIELPLSSRDGLYLAFTRRSAVNANTYSEWIMRTDGTELVEIKIPVHLLKE